MQLEVPLEPLQTAAAIARSHGRRILLNPAPAQRLPGSFLGLVDVIIPNETETQTLTGLSSRDDSSLVRAARSLLTQGPKAVVLTLGARGALLVNEELAEFIPAHRVDVVDTTGAGDAFCGALAAALARQQDLTDAVRFANAAGALATTRLGAEPSMPKASEVAELLASNRAAHAEEQRT
jgi:ribokinase